MEPEWNHPINMDDATMLGLKQNISQPASNKFTTMHFGWLLNRSWSLRFSFSKRICYLTGENIQFKFAYRGRKYIQSIMSRNKSTHDDIWISQRSYLNLIANGKIN